MNTAENEGYTYTERWAMGVGDEKEKYEDGSPSNGIILWFNAEPFHFGGAALSLWHQAVLQQLIPQDSTAQVNVRNQPLGIDEDVDFSSILIVGK